MPAPTLVHSCTKACIKNIRSLLDVGDFEYWKIKNVLARIDSPEQLHQIELRSPQIKGEDAELWHAFIQRDVPNWRTKNYMPKNPTKWYEIYLKYKKEQQKELERDEEVLKRSLADINRKKAGNVSRIVELRTLPRLPRDPRMIANNGGVPIGRRENGVIKPTASSFTWTSGSKTKLTTGKSVMARARREAKDMSMRAKLSKPTTELRQGQVKKAPAGMVDEYRRDRQPVVKILSRKKSNATECATGLRRPSLEDRENRLRALTMSRGNAAGVAEATLVGSSSDELDESDLEGLFDEKPSPRPQGRLSAMSSRPPVSSTSSSRAATPLSTARLHSRQALSLSPSATSSSQPHPGPRPSGTFASISSKPRPEPDARALSPPGSSTPTTGTPSPGTATKPVKGMIKRRAPADPFHAPSKKPRLR